MAMGHGMTPAPLPADVAIPPPRVAIRAWCVVANLVTAQFFTCYADGTMTPAGILSLPVEEWRTPAWQRIRDAAAYVEDFTRAG